MQFFHCNIILFLFGSNIFLSTLFSNTLSLCSAFNVRDLVSHPNKTGKIVVLSFLIAFLASRQENKKV
jgi:hypothetical protein